MWAKTKVIGFLLGLTLFGVILGSVLFHRVLENLWLVAALLLVNFTVIFILPRIFPRIALSSEIKRGLEEFTKLLNKVVVGIALVFVYVIGVGLIKLTGIVMRKNFIRMKAKGNSTWIDVSNNKNDFEDMF